MTYETSALLRNTSGNEQARVYSGNCLNADSEQAPEPPTSKQNIALMPLVISLTIGTFLAAMEGTIVISSYAAIGSELKQLQSTSWISTAYLLTLTSFQPLYGKLSDIFGRKACLLFAYSVFALGCLLCGLARNMSELIAARAFAGIGGGGLFTIVSIIMSDMVPLRSRGTWFGIVNLIWATGSATGAPLGGFCADTIGWRWAFFIQIPATIFAILVVSVSLRLPASRAGSSDFSARLKRVDFAGAISLVLAIFFPLFGLDRGGNVSWTDTLTIASSIAFAVIFPTFCVIEMKFANEPFAPKRIIFNRSLIASYLVNFFSMGSGSSMMFHVSLYLQVVQRKTASEASIWLLPSIIGIVFGSLLSGLIMQFTGKYYFLAFVAYTSSLAGTSLVTLTSGVITQSAIGISHGLFVSGIGIGGGLPISLISLIANAGTDDLAIATGVSYLFRSLGSVVCLSVGSTLVQDVLRSSLRLKLFGEDVNEIINGVRASLTYIDRLDAGTRTIVISSYEQAVHVAFWFSVIVSACAVFASVFIEEKSLAGRN